MFRMKRDYDSDGVMPVGSETKRKAAAKQTWRDTIKSRKIGRAKGGVSRRRLRRMEW